MSGLPDPVTRSRVRQFHRVYLWWDDLLGPTALPGPRDQIAADLTVVNGVAEIVVAGLRDVTSRLGLVTHLGVVRVGSGPDLRHCRDGPARPGRLILGTFWRVSSSSRPSVDRRSLPEQHHRGRRKSADKEKSGSSHVSRRDVELSHVIPEPPEKRTITVIQSPPRLAEEDDSAGGTGPTGSAEVADSAEVQDSAGVDEPAVVKDSAGDDDLSQVWQSRTRQVLKRAVVKDSACEDSAGVADSADRQLTTQQGGRACCPGYPSRDDAS